MTGQARDEEDEEEEELYSNTFIFPLLGQNKLILILILHKRCCHRI